MDIQLVGLCFLTFTIHFLGAMAYASRIAGVRTRSIAASWAIYNILQLVSRAANSLQEPFIGKRIETHLDPRWGDRLLSDFRWILLSAALAAIVAAILMPTAQRLFTLAVTDFRSHKSLFKLFSGGFISSRRASERFWAFPSKNNIFALTRIHVVPARIIVLNIVTHALFTVGVLATLYAGYLQPSYRVTAVALSPVINSIATLSLFLFIDPYLSILTDDTVDGRLRQEDFRQAIVVLTASRIVGAFFAQILLVPSAMLIVIIARMI